MTQDKRYSIFISSTFTDLIQERQEVQTAILRLDHFPVGMEQWPAADDEQFEFIKRVIDESDYYIVVVAGRCGTVSPSGLSYTEMEYNYAIERGIKVIVLLHKDPGSIPADKTEAEPKLRKKLEAFKDKLSKGRMRKTWTNKKDLAAELTYALLYATKTWPATGWVRGDKAASDELREENVKLREELLTLKTSQPTPGILNLAGMGEEYLITLDDWQDVSWSWARIFCVVGPLILTPSPEYEVRTAIMVGVDPGYGTRDWGNRGSVTDKSMGDIKVHLLALGLIDVRDIRSGSSNHTGWDLTDSGRNVLLQLRSSKTTKELNEGE